MLSFSKTRSCVQWTTSYLAGSLNRARPLSSSNNIINIVPFNNSNTFIRSFTSCASSRTSNNSRRINNSSQLFTHLSANNAPSSLFFNSSSSSHYTTSASAASTAHQQQQVDNSQQHGKGQTNNNSQQQSSSSSFNLLNYKKTLLLLLSGLSLAAYIKMFPDSEAALYARIFMRFQRAIRTALLVSINYKMLARTPLTDPSYPAKEKICQKDSAVKILELCLTNGGLYVKAGQYIASLNHILPLEYTKTLEVLQDQAPWRQYDDIAVVFKDDLGHYPEFYFKEFEKTPIAAASLAQVHRAWTRDNDEVAVKIQYPDLQANFESDVFTHKILLKMINYAFPDFEFNWIADEMRNVLVKEMDFVQEADNADRTARDLRDNPDVHIPKIFRDYSSRRILTTEFIHGCKVNSVEKIRALGLREKDVAQKLLEIASEQIFIHGFVHVDPHAGNILVRRHPDNPKMPQIVLLDHGLYRELDDQFRQNFCHLYKNLVLCNNEKVKKYSALLGIENYQLFSTIVLMRRFETASVGLGTKLSKEDLHKMMDDAMEKMKEINQLMKSMPRHLLLILRNNNLIRSINMDLGSPINRFSIMARYATRGINSKIEQGGFSMRRMVSRIKEKVSFEARLRGYEFYYWLMAISLRIMLRLGLFSPEKQ
ncbi:hypothetical protein SAMD00019534_034050 [Acytostelium subglobosum LB1]|uniref:hypothetical protein n=1 Tax=Acytostelium subglobosum LB1 TaxID=1410327 RepID=UPI000644DE96|nr:hypothetical protein SAMD00019534_034050 [Acytostelium subglobosum LB1]GAM20230.1 hypothetical protein SAMD00019534_034050 [Acytostelium subglobosum LB1]|eukprot:XP_012759751.1 hypothetical protein SAMD00019534_034050 [Acytostelium subglobosum LB1]